MQHRSRGGGAGVPASRVDGRLHWRAFGCVAVLLWVSFNNALALASSYPLLDLDIAAPALAQAKRNNVAKQRILGLLNKVRNSAVDLSLDVNLKMAPLLFC